MIKHLFKTSLLAFALILPSKADDAKRPNVLLICVDDLRPELNCFGKSYIHSPHIDELAESGRTFSRHYVQAPTCGASRYTLLTGHYGSDNNNALFERGEALKEGKKTFTSMPGYFNQHGYTTVSVGKVSHHPGGRGGRDWDDNNTHEMPGAWTRHINPNGQWQHPRGTMHGLAHGEIRGNAKEMAVYQSEKGPDDIYPDGLVTVEALQQLNLLKKDSNKPFFLAVGITRPHLPFGAPAKYMEHYKNTTLPAIPHPAKPSWKSTWHKSGEFMKYLRWDRDPNTDPEFADLVRKHYAACVSYADAQIGEILNALKKKKLHDNTIVVLWGDHGWNLGERGIWGKHCLFEESLRSPLIISYPKIASPGKNTKAIVETNDVFPTLCELAGLSIPAHLHGKSLTKQLNNPNAKGTPALAYRSSNRTIRNDRFRLIAHSNGHNELYDFKHEHPGRDNVADQHPEVIKTLRKQINEIISKKPQDIYKVKTPKRSKKK